MRVGSIPTACDNFVMYVTLVKSPNEDPDGQPPSYESVNNSNTSYPYLTKSKVLMVFQPAFWYISCSFHMGGCNRNMIYWEGMAASQILHTLTFTMKLLWWKIATGLYPTLKNPEIFRLSWKLKLDSLIYIFLKSQWYISLCKMCLMVSFRGIWSLALRGRALLH